MNIEISLKQGKKFNHYQNKIKNETIKKEKSLKKKNIKEGYINIFEIEKNNKLNTSSENTQENVTYNNLSNTYNILRSNYNTAAQKLTSNASDVLFREGSSNPYKSTNIRFENGAIGYVTNMGNYKYFPDMNVYNNTTGKNGCPSSFKEVPSITNAYDYNTKGALLQTRPNLLVDTPMQLGQSCGSEGQNVYVNSMVGNGNNPEYLKCYNNFRKNDSGPNVPAIITQAITYYPFEPGQFNFTDVGLAKLKLNRYGNVAVGSLGGKNCVIFASNGYMVSEPFNIPNQLSMAYWAYIPPNTRDGETVSIGDGSFSGNTSVFQGDIYSNVLKTFIALPNFWTYVNGPSSTNTWIHIAYTIDVANKSIKLYINGSLYTNVTTAGNGSWGKLSSYRYTFGRASDTAPRYLNGGGLSQFLAFNKILSQQEITDIYNYTRSPIPTPPPYDTSVSAMTYAYINGSTNNPVTFENCKLYAENNQYSYFGMQNVGSDGKGLCMVSNDFSNIQQFGDAIIYNAYSVWNSGSPGYLNAFVNNGQLCLIGSSGKNPICYPTNPVADCQIGGNINPDGLVATYGGNCSSNGYNIITGNATNKVKQLLSAAGNPAQLLVQVNNGVFGDPAYGCYKNYNTAYKCGNTWKTGSSAENQNYVYDCSASINSCKCFLYLQSDGNMCVYKGTINKIEGNALWCSYTQGKQKDTNPDWVSSKGKNGRCYLLQGETLEINEWIGSDNGSMKLIMQQDGYLSLLMCYKSTGCKPTSYGEGGGEVSNAVYKLPVVGNKSLIGKVGYVDENAVLHEYPSSMIGKSIEYNLMKNTNSWGNDISLTQNSDPSKCKVDCNNNPNCFGFVFDNNNDNCWLKNSSVYPQGTFINKESGSDLYIRKPQVYNNSSCSKQMNPINSIQYKNYIKGNEMNLETNCGAKLVNEIDKAKLTSAENQLDGISQQISSKSNILDNTTYNINNKITTDYGDMKDNLKDYQNIKGKIYNILNPNSLDKSNEIIINNNINSLMESMLNMEDIDAMVSDSDLNVLKNNYQYILWSIVALTAIIITINTLKK